MSNIKEERYQAPRGNIGWNVIDSHTNQVLLHDVTPFAEAALIAEGLNDGIHEVYEIDGVQMLLMTV